MTIHFEEASFRKKVIKTIADEPVPVGMVYCVGRNYAKHIEEMKSENLGQPVIFTKPPTAVCQDFGTVPLPEMSQEIHHEVELALVIGKKGNRIPIDEAGDYIAGSAIALDLTMRDVQAEAKKKGTPWAIAKGFDYSCPISRIYPETDLEKLSHVELYLEKNNKRVQQGNTRNMIFKLDYLISYLSNIFTLQPGDIILTGTPEGVGPILPGDELTFYSSFTPAISLHFARTF